VAFLPVALIFLVVGGFLSARFVTRFEMKLVLLASMISLAAGFVLLSRITVGTSYFLDLLPSMLVAAFGAALAFTAFNIAALSGAKQGEEGLASGLVNTSTQVGGPIGLAIAVTIATTAAAALAGQLQPTAATVTGFGYAFLGDAVLAGIGLVFALTLTRPKLAQEATPPAPQAEKKEAMEIRKIMVAVDGSENGYRAAQTAIKLAKDYHAELVVLRVVTVPTALTPAGNRAGGSAILKEFYDYADKDAKDYVDRLANEAKSLGVPLAKGEVVRAESSPASAISDKAKNEGVDLIVIGTRGLDRPKRLLLGSVSSGVVANSSSQVLVVK
jgi:nucleotide-binding universal stress UspA family protein